MELVLRDERLRLKGQLPGCILVSPSALVEEQLLHSTSPGRRLLTRFPIQNCVEEVQTQINPLIGYICTPKPNSDK